ncbi:MAG: RimK family alpha-L-glutamate ligase [Flammeovirgaceae bacterium]
MKVGIVTCAEFPHLTDQEKPLIDLFAAKGICITPLVWNDPSIDWKHYDCLLLRSIWDYHLHIEEFFAWLNLLEKQNVTTLNPLEVVNWNRHKFYLRELEKNGINIIPTLFIEKGSDFSPTALKNKGWEQAVIKPAISANSHLTELFHITDSKLVEEKYRRLAQHHDLLVQSFMPEIQTQGEVSLVFLGKHYSHAVLKKPALGDFRVQADYGGKAEPFHANPAIIRAGNQILSHIPLNLLYARVDGVIHENQFFLMELELIEPELLFDHAPAARGVFVESATQLLQSNHLP